MSSTFQEKGDLSIPGSASKLLKYDATYFSRDTVSLQFRMLSLMPREDKQKYKYRNKSFLY